MDVLIKFRHGLGDAVQLTTVLDHLCHYHPDWQIDVAALSGKHSAFHGQCRRTILLEHNSRLLSKYDRVFDLPWHECAACYADWPSTKAERCLLEVFGVEPIASRCCYRIRTGETATGAARQYLENVCRVLTSPGERYPAVLIHYQGNTSPEHKNLSDSTVRAICEDVVECGMVPVILDWDTRSPLPDGRRIHCPHADVELWGGMGTGDAEVLAALCELASLMIGIDSGPLHVAGATSTPTIGVWTGHHPLHYFGHADNTTHLIPQDHARHLRGSAETGLGYFVKHYRYRTYTNLESELREVVSETLRANNGSSETL